MDRWDPWPDENNKQHTPKKLSKLEVSCCTNTTMNNECTTNTSLYDPCTRSVLKCKENNANSKVKSDIDKEYLIDLENDHLSKYQYLRNKSGTTVANQSMGATPCTAYNDQSQEITTSSEHKLVKTSADMSTYRNTILTSTSLGSDQSQLTDNKKSQDLCSQYVYSQNPVLSITPLPRCSKDNQIDASFDQGYCSYSTGSSYQGQDSQRDGSVMEHESQIDPDMQQDGWLTGNKTIDSTSGDNDLEDLLYHFQKFFHDRFESEMHQFQEAVYDILQEQQDHVRQIVHTAIREQNPIQNNHADETHSEESKKVLDTKTSSGNSDISFTQMLNTDFYLPSIPALTVTQSSSILKEDMVRKRLLELYSLSCSVSTLLAKRQFKT